MANMKNFELNTPISDEQDYREFPESRQACCVKCGEEVLGEDGGLCGYFVRESGRKGVSAWEQMHIPFRAVDEPCSEA